MIIKRKWIKRTRGGTRVVKREGWFLLGIIPLYVRDVELN